MGMTFELGIVGWLSAKALPCKHDGLSSDPCHAYKKLDVVMCSCNPGGEREETGGSLKLSGQGAQPNEGTPVSMRGSVHQNKE